MSLNPEDYLRTSDFWQIEDARAGRCKLTDVGAVRSRLTPIPPPTIPEPDPPRDPATGKLLPFHAGVLAAFYRLGGVDFLVEWGRDNPNEFARLCARLIPSQIHGAGEQGEHVVTIVHAIRRTPLDGVEVIDGQVVQED
jgi:hypothetical protein